MARMIGSNIKAARRRAGKMPAQELANLCAELGYPIQRDVITNLENGRRASVPVTDLIVIAAALGVPALSLIFEPTAAGEEVEMVPGRKCYVWDAFDDFAGQRPKDFGSHLRHPDTFDTWRRTELLRNLSKWEIAAFEYVTDADALREAWAHQSRLEKVTEKRDTVVAEASLDDPWADQYQSSADYQEQIEVLETAAKRALRAVHDHRRELEVLQVKVWPITAALRSRFDALLVQEKEM